MGCLGPPAAWLPNKSNMTCYSKAYQNRKIMLRACREKIIMMSEEGFDLRKKKRNLHSVFTVSIGSCCRVGRAASKDSYSCTCRLMVQPVFFRRPWERLGPWMEGDPKQRGFGRKLSQARIFPTIGSRRFHSPLPSVLLTLSSHSLLALNGTGCCFHEGKRKQDCGIEPGSTSFRKRSAIIIK